VIRAGVIRAGVIRGGVIRGGVILNYGQDLRSAGRTPEHAIGEAAHLGVAALTGMTSPRVRQGDYPAQRVQDA
jgi:hypothetical protein